jgi:hypothetical protein
LIEFIVDQSRDVSDFKVVVEDMRPYNMRITDGVINTIKYIGQVEWRLKMLDIQFTLIPRWEVKQWVFTRFREMAEVEIVKKIEYSRERKKKLGLYMRADVPAQTFVYVDDRIVQKAMRGLWRIPKPKVGQKATYGLKDHSWQALGLLSRYIALYKPPFALNFATF